MFEWNCIKLKHLHTAKKTIFIAKRVYKAEENHWQLLICKGINIWNTERTKEEKNTSKWVHELKSQSSKRRHLLNQHVANVQHP